MISSKHFANGIVAVGAFPIMLAMWVHSLIDPKGFWKRMGRKDHPNGDKRGSFITFIADL